MGGRLPFVRYNEVGERRGDPGRKWELSENVDFVLKVQFIQSGGRKVRVERLDSPSPTWYSDKEKFHRARRRLDDSRGDIGSSQTSNSLSVSTNVLVHRYRGTLVGGIPRVREKGPRERVVTVLFVPSQEG